MGIGTLFRYLIIAIIVLYLFNKVGKFFTRLFFGEGEKKTGKRGFDQQNQSKSGNIHVDNNPKAEKKFTAGEYVDYEELD